MYVSWISMVLTVGKWLTKLMVKHSAVFSFRFMSRPYVITQGKVAKMKSIMTL